MAKYRYSTIFYGIVNNPDNPFHGQPICECQMAFESNRLLSREEVLFEAHCAAKKHIDEHPSHVPHRIFFRELRPKIMHTLRYRWHYPYVIYWANWLPRSLVIWMYPNETPEADEANPGQA